MGTVPLGPQATCLRGTSWLPDFSSQLPPWPLGRAFPVLLLGELLFSEFSNVLMGW